MPFCFWHLRRASLARQALHDVATPLTNVMLDLDDWSQTATSGDVSADITSRLESLRSQMQAAFSFLRPFARDANNNEKQAFSAYDLVEEIINTYQKPYHVHCSLEGAAKESLPLLFGCPQDFAQIVIHLLNNAAESYPCQRVERQVAVSLTYHWNSLRLGVIDHGDGMNPLEVWSLLHPRWRFLLSPWTGSHKSFRSGLGLARVHHLLQTSFHARLECTSRRHCGTQMTVIFPLGNATLV